MTTAIEAIALAAYTLVALYLYSVLLMVAGGGPKCNQVALCMAVSFLTAILWPVWAALYILFRYILGIKP